MPAVVMGVDVSGMRRYVADRNALLRFKSCPKRPCEILRKVNS